MNTPKRRGSVARVQTAATDLGLNITVRDMPASTRTADEAAIACGCSVGEIVKSLVFRGTRTGTPYLLLVSGKNQVDENAIAKHLGEAVSQPDGKEVRALTGFAIGGVAPIGHLTPVMTFMDEDLLAFERVWAAAGAPHTVFSTDPDALKDATGAETLSMKAH